MSAVATDTAWYVFGVVSAREAAGLGTPAIEHDELAALVSAVPLSEFGEDVLPERLNDRMWLEAKVRAHQELLQEATESATVVPFRFGTIYRDVDDVRGMLRERRDELLVSLDRVRGKVELGVKAWAATEAEEPSTAAASGRAYLQRRLDTLEQSRHATSRLAEAAGSAHERLLRHAAEGVANRPQPPELTGRRERMILNGAYLVADPGPLLAEVESLQRDFAELAFEATGPWPAYNFVAVEGAE